MEAWRVLAVQLFPKHQVRFEDEEETVWDILRDMLFEARKAHRNGDIDSLKSIYGFAAWCFAQREIEPELWHAAVPVFYEHLVDWEETFHAIPQWLSRDLFRELLPVFRHRLINLPRDYGLKQPGSYEQLLTHYDQEHSTNFGSEWSNQVSDR